MRQDKNSKPIGRINSNELNSKKLEKAEENHLNTNELEYNDNSLLKRSGQEREFLPAALEILDTPANPAGRALAVSLSIFFTIAVTWAMIGEIDIVAIAQGRIVPVGGVKKIQPKEIGSVRSIHVTDGQHVSRGELLIELDPTDSEVDMGQLKRQRMEASTEVARLKAFIRVLRGEQLEFPPPDHRATVALIELNKFRLKSDIAALQAELASLKAELSKRLASLAAIKREIKKIQEILPLMGEREEALFQLLTNGNAPKAMWHEAKTLLIENQNNIIIQGHKEEEAKAGLVALEKQRERIIANLQQQTYNELAEAEKEFAQSVLAMKKALNRDDLNRIRAPVSGTVQQLAVQTVGGVVRPAELLMVIVPDQAALEVRAELQNKDKGFITEGQVVEIKLETFNFTKYGTIDGVVEFISHDAVEKEEKGLIYETRVSLDKTVINANGANVDLLPGMAVTVEIKTGKRKIIEFLLSPFQRYQDEAIRER